VKGFDISTYQDSPLVAGHVDFAKMRAWGADFVIIRAGQGTWKDEDFDRSWDNAKGVLPRSSYFFYDNRFKPQDQAEKYHEIISRDPEGFCWLDIEHTVSGAYGNLDGWYNFLVKFHSLCNYPVGIYTGFWYFVERTALETSFEKQYFAKYPLWLASYPPDPFNVDHSKIRIPYPWKKYIMLQSGTPAIGLEAGVESRDIDYNIFMDNSEFTKFFTPVIIPPPAGGEMFRGTINTIAKLWREPGIGQIDTIPVNTVVTGDAPLGEYVYLRSPQAGYTKKIWLTGYTLVTTPPPPVEEPPTEPPTTPVPVSGTFTLDMSDGTKQTYNIGTFTKVG
jgi:hypothetical protein